MDRKVLEILGEHSPEVAGLPVAETIEQFGMATNITVVGDTQLSETAHAEALDLSLLELSTKPKITASASTFVSIDEGNESDTKVTEIYFNSF